MEKVKKLIKKHFNKFFIGILTLISAIAIGIGISSNYNKSYAYQTDSFTYTLSFDSSYYSTIDGVNGILVNNSYKYFYNLDNNIMKPGYYLLFNYYLVNNSNNIITDVSSLNPTFAPNISVGIYNNDNYRGSIDYYLKLGWRTLNINYNTFVGLLDLNNDYAFNKLRFYSDSQYFHPFIYNIDIVSPSDIGLSQYYDTYYGEIENNYNTLLSNYNDLQDNYDTLNNNYTTLQSNYDVLLEEKNELQQEITDLNEYYSTLQTNYNTLQTNYNNLNLNYTTLQTTYDNLLSDYNELQSNYNTMLSNYNQISASYEALQNLNVPFNPSFINAYTITLNDNILSDIPLNSFIDFNYNSIIINYNDINLQDNEYSTDSNNIITITINYKDSAYIDNLKGYVYSRHSYNDYTDISFIYNNNVVYQNSNMNNEHTDNNGDIAQYELLIGQTFDTLVISYRCDDLTLYDNQSSKLYTFGTYYEGYQEGIEANNVYYTNLVNQYTTTINNLTSSNNDLNAVNKQLKSNISYYENQINDYIEQIENLSITSNSSYNSGYQAGLNEGASSNLETNGFKTLLNAILSYPINMIKTIFNFEFMGVNIAGLITFIISLGIVIFIIKKFVNK